MPKSDSLRILPLGGLGQIGGNMMILETRSDLIVVDCGILFPRSDELGVDAVLPNVDYLVRHRDRLRGYVLTHAHEDHVGALPRIFPEAPAPVYGSKFSIALLRMKLGEYPDVDMDMRVVDDGERFELGDFSLEAVPITHSIVGAFLLAIETPIGRVVHTGDFRLDREPIDGRQTDERAIRNLGEQGVVLLLSDSTNSKRGGWTQSESEIRESLTKQIGDTDHRVAITTFSSNLHRIQSVIDASDRVGRTVIPVGRGMIQMVQLGVENGFLKAPRGTLADVSNFDSFTRNQVTLLISGSQGEARGSFARIAEASHRLVRLEAGDTVIVSARRIPGNEARINRTINNLYRQGIEVIDDRVALVHTSGHAYQEEQRAMLSWLKPEFFVPVHGEYQHLVHHARTAEGCGVASDKVFIIEDGEPLDFRSGPDGVRAHRGPVLDVTPVYVSGSTIGAVDEVVLRDRQILADQGIVFCVVVLDENDRIQTGPDIGTRGVFHVDEHPDVIESAAWEVRSAIDNVRDQPEDLDAWSGVVRQALKRYFRREHDVRPLLVAMVLRAD